MKANLLTGIILLAIFSCKTYAQTNNAKLQSGTPKTSSMKQILIDKFSVPENAKQEFIERMNINRNFIKKLNGFIEDAAYERADEHGNLIYITIAVWGSKDALEKAKEVVQDEYKKKGFNPKEMFDRLNITMDRATYKEIPLQP